MCGITGLLLRGTSSGSLGLDQICNRMSNSLQHRGPDGGAAWIDVEAGIGLGHRRLSIIDLSASGDQPMVSANGRWVIVYNGELYNTEELRAEISLIPYRGHSDTEVILEGCALWGVEATVRKLNGIFAFAIWDRQDRTLYLVRDRLGVKPLYWGMAGRSLVFGSELKALRNHPDFAADIDRDALAAYMRFAYVPAPLTIYKGIRKLKQGAILTVASGREPVETIYWSMRDVVQTGLRTRLTLSDADAIAELDALLRDAVGRQMVSDVPLGAFLSGGVDSSTVVALMQAQSAQPVCTFSIGFNEKGYDEAGYARAVAQHLGTRHTELYMDDNHARDVIPRLPQIYDEPFSDSSQIPTFLVSELTRRHVTVSLSGDGGDELFAGYNRYLLADSWWRRIDRVPTGLRKGLAGGIVSMPPQVWNRLLPEMIRRRGITGERLHKLASILGGTAEDLYLTLVSQWNDPGALVIGGRETLGPFDDDPADHLPLDHIERMQYLDTITYLPDDILTKVDRASMAASLEARVPLLDHRVVEYAWRLPMSFKLRGRESKWLLRQVLYRYVPQALIDRPKMGFGIPIDSWLRGPLRDWAEHLLDSRRLRDEGYIRPRPVREKLDAHLSGAGNFQYPLWTVLMFQAWLEHHNAGREHI